MSDPDQLSGDDAEVRALLQQLPRPTMPADVAERIDDALRESAAPPATVVPLHHDQARGRSRLTRVVPVAASAAGLLVISGIVVSVLHDDGSQSSGSALEASAGGSVTSPGAPAVVESGGDYTKQRLVQQLDRALAANPPKTSDGSTSTPQSGPAVDEAQRLNDQAQACVTGLTQDASVQPYLLDRATFDGRDALIVAVPGQVLPNTVEVFVVGRNCAGPSPRLLYYRVVDRAALPAIAHLPTPSPTVS